MLIAWMVIGELFTVSGFLALFTGATIFGSILVFMGLGMYYYGIHPGKKKALQLAGVIIGAAAIAWGVSIFPSIWSSPFFIELAAIAGLIAGGCFFLIATPRIATSAWNRRMIADYHNQQFQFPHEVFR